MVGPFWLSAGSLIPRNAVFILCIENSRNLDCYITLRVHSINGQSTVPPLCSSLILHINYEEFIFFQNSMLKGKWGWPPSRGFPFSIGNMIRPLHSKLSMVDMSSALSSKSKMLAFSSIREGVTDLGITTVIRKIKKIYVDVYLLEKPIHTSLNMLLFLPRY